MSTQYEKDAEGLDYRDLNLDLSIFATDPLIGAGLPLWLPAGAAIRHELERLARELALRDGCVPVYSPVLAKRALFERSGHLAKFSDDMFPPMRVGGEELMLRPANCPHHAAIYRARPHSYRELPIRYNELAPMFRSERSGVLSGLSRVRQINLDDTHVFCRPDQVASEVARALRCALDAQNALGLPVDYVRLSRRGSGTGYLGTASQWDHAEDALRIAAAQVLAKSPVPWSEAEGEAAFYGPKLDLQVRDSRGHEESIATVQLDFNQPERFDLTYIAADGTEQRALMVHRGTVGAMERVVAALLERYQGRLPFWLAPVQVCVLPVLPGQDETARALFDQLVAAGLRPRLEPDGSLGARARASRQRRDSLVGVIGASEAAAGAVHVTDFRSGFKGPVERSLFVEVLRRAYASRGPQISWPIAPGGGRSVMAPAENAES